MDSTQGILQSGQSISSSQDYAQLVEQINQWINMARVKANEELFGQNVLNDITIKPFVDTLADDGAEIKTLAREAVDFILLVEQIQSLFTCYNNYYLIQIEDCMQDNFTIKELFRLGQRIVLGKINTLVN